MTFLGDWLPRMVNFALITALVCYFTRKHVPDTLKNRSSASTQAKHASQQTPDPAVSDHSGKVENIT